MESSSILSFDAQNPWSSTDNILAPLKSALILAERTGHIRKRSDYDAQHLEKDIHDRMPSLKLISQLKKVTAAKKEHNRVNLEIQKRMQDKETSDITHVDLLDEKVKKISSLNAHVQSILDSKSQLIMRLQQPFVGDFIKLEAQYHRFASELFPEIAPLLADLNTHLENISWTKTLTFSDGKMDSLLTELSSTLAALQTNYEALSQMRQSMKNLYTHQSDES